jgi:hypothetical protein
MLNIEGDEIVEWRPWPRDPRYIVGSDGTIIGRRGRTVGAASGGRRRLSLPGSTVTVATVVCETFHGPIPKPGMHAAHEDGNSLNDRAGNLSWKTVVENHADKKRHGTQLRGDAVPGAKLNAEVIQIIRHEVTQGVSRKALASRFSVTESSIGHIVNRKTWSHVQ